MKDQTNQCFWQHVAKFYAPLMKSVAPLYDRICERGQLYLTKEMDVLELACGSGQLSFRMAKYARRWEATDFSKKMVMEAKSSCSPQI